MAGTRPTTKSDRELREATRGWSSADLRRALELHRADIVDVLDRRVQAVIGELSRLPAGADQPLLARAESAAREAFRKYRDHLRSGSRRARLAAREPVEAMRARVVDAIERARQSRRGITVTVTRPRRDPRGRPSPLGRGDTEEIGFEVRSLYADVFLSLHTAKISARRNGHAPRVPDVVRDIGEWQDWSDRAPRAIQTAVKKALRERRGTPSQARVVTLEVLRRVGVDTQAGVKPINLTELALERLVRNGIAGLP